MTKDLAYYRTLAYEREWLPRDDESGRYFVVRLKDIPEIYGTGDTKQKALVQLRTAFDEQIAWCLEEQIPIPEPSPARISSYQTVNVIIERMNVTRAALPADSYHTKAPVDLAELVPAA